MIGSFKCLAPTQYIWKKPLIVPYLLIKVTEDVAVSYGGKNFDGTEGVRNLLDNSFNDINKAINIRNALNEYYKFILMVEDR